MKTGSKKAETLLEFASIYEPWSDAKNNPLAKANDLAAAIKKHTGRDIGIDDKINFEDKALLTAIIKELPTRETGKFVSDFITFEDAESAASAALSGEKPVIAGRAPYRGEQYQMPATTGSSSPYVGAQGDIAAAMSAEIAEYTDYAIGRGVKYNRRSKDNPDQRRSVDEGAIDCSGWIGESGVRMMERINLAAGAEVFSQEDIKALKVATDTGGAAGIIKTFSDKAGGQLLDKSQLTPDKARAGMFIGLDTGPTKWDGGRFHGIDHIVQTYIDPKTGELMVSQSSGGKGVNRMTYKQWYNSLGKNTKLYATDITRIANAAKLKPGQGGGIPGMRMDVKSSATDILQDAMKAGNGQVTPEVITALMDRYRKKAEGDQGQLAVLDEVERSLHGVLSVDETRRASDETTQQAAADMRHKWDGELKDFYQQMNGEVAESYETAHLAWMAEAPNSEKADIKHLEQTLGRYQSGLDITKEGVVDYEGLANLLSATIKRESGRDITFDKGIFKSEVIKNNTESAIASADTEENAIAHVRKILGSSNLNLSKEDIEIAANDEVFRSAVLSTGLHALSPDDKQGIVQSFLNKATSAEKARHGKELGATENIYLPLIEDASEISLPGINKLGKEYDKARSAIKNRAFKGENSTPFIINATRLSMLKKLSQNPQVGSYYKDQFRIEAKRNGFDDAWVDKQLENINDITHGDLKGSADFKSLTEDDMRDVNTISDALSRELGNTPAKSKDVIDKYEANLARENAPLTRQQATYMAAKNMADANQLARRLGMKPEDLLTAPGIEKAHRMLVEGKLGQQEEIKMVAAAWKKHQSGDQLTYSDFVPIRATRRNSDDEFTIDARSQGREGGLLSRTVQQEEQAKQTAIPEAQQQQKDGAASQTGPGSPLKDETIQKLNKAIEALVDFLKGKGVPPPPPDPRR